MFDDGEILGAIVTAGLILLPLWFAGTKMNKENEQNK